MRKILNRRPSPALVLAVVALFAALSAGAAAELPGIGVVTSGEIKNNTIRGKDIRNATIASRDVRDGSLVAKDFEAGELPAGPRGPEGPQGVPGVQGSPGLTKLVYRKGHTNPPVAAGETAGFAVGCPESAPTVVSGGYYVNDVAANFRVVTTSPIDGGDPDGLPDDSWEVSLHNVGPGPVTLTTYAVCTAATEVDVAPDQL